MKEQIEEMADKPSLERQRRGEYVRRIFEAVRYKGTEDHEDVWSILWDFQEEIKAGYRKQSAWISVDERLPNEAESVLAYGETGICFATRYKGDWLTPMIYYGELTHWMPIPEPPMMKGGAE